MCQQGVNVLEILDISDPSAPSLLASYDMQNPHGLGLSGTNLFICEGQFGLKSFDASDIFKIDQNQFEHLTNIHAIDLIPGPNSLIVIGNSVITQYDYSQPEKLIKLSQINIEQL